MQSRCEPVPIRENREPPWYSNLVAHPEAIMEVGGERLRVRATRAERRRLYGRQAAQLPTLAEYEKTSRQIPVIVLRRMD